MADEVRVSTIPSGAAALVLWPEGEEIFYRAPAEPPPVEAAGEFAAELAEDLEVPVVFDPSQEG